MRGRRLYFSSLLNNLLWVLTLLGALYFALTFNLKLGWIVLYFLAGIYGVNIITLLYPIAPIETINDEPLDIDANQPSFTLAFQLKHRQYDPHSLQATLRVPHTSIVLETLECRYDHDQLLLAFPTDILGRGVYPNARLTLVYSDRFGMFKRRRSILLTSPLIVSPQLRPELDEPFNILYQNIRRIPLSLSGRKTFDLKNIRKYQSGDHFKLIDWKSTSKSNVLMSRELEDEHQMDTDILFMADNQGGFEEALSFFYTIQKTMDLTSWSMLDDEGTLAASIPMNFAALQPYTSLSSLIQTLHNTQQSTHRKIIITNTLHDELTAFLTQDPIMNHTFVIVYSGTNLPELKYQVSRFASNRGPSR